MEPFAQTADMREWREEPMIPAELYAEGVEYVWQSSMFEMDGKLHLTHGFTLEESMHSAWNSQHFIFEPISRT